MGLAVNQLTSVSGGSNPSPPTGILSRSSSVAERFLGKKEVRSPILLSGSGTKLNKIIIWQQKENRTLNCNVKRAKKCIMRLINQKKSPISLR